jgi:hypothetical protein
MPVSPTMLAKILMIVNILTGRAAANIGFP